MPTETEPFLIMMVSRSDLDKLIPLPNASVTDLKHLASYNWIEAPTPTIVVPGLPPFWRGSNHPRRLKKDSGLVYIAQNAARHPESPLEPLFRALYIEDPSFDLSSVDIVSDRNNIRKLLSFVDPLSNAHGVKSFTMQMEIINGTAILHREEASNEEFIGPSEYRGYGHEFEKAYTTNQIPLSTGHHRIISYRLGDLRLIVRHETDGYMDINAPARSADLEPAGDSLSQLLESLSISQPAVPLKTTHNSSKLTVLRAGRRVALESTLEIKTRIRRKPLSIADVAPQLWVSQTPRLVRAYHENGTFGIPVVEDVTTELRSWEETNQENLGRLAALLVCIVAKARVHGHVNVRYDEASDRLHIEQCEKKRMFPVDLYRWWKDGRTKELFQDSERDGLLSSSIQASVNNGGNDEVRQHLATSPHTPGLTHQEIARQSTTLCYICKRMRTDRPYLHRASATVVETRTCLLCCRDFCDKHSGEDKAVCEINHITYHRNHTHIQGVYPSIAARESGLGERDSN